MKMKTKLCLISMTLILIAKYVVGDNPLQVALSTLECFKYNQQGCNEDFTVAYPELSRSYDNFTEAATKFYLFTPNNPDDPELMHKCGGGLPPITNFNPRCKTIFVTPGFFSGICHFGIYKELLYQRMKCGCYNYIQVEWTWGNSFDFVTATKNIKIVAKQVAVVIRKLKRMFYLTAKDFIIVGHSLGAHIAGLIGQIETVNEIHGLDAGGLMYSVSTDKNERLSPDDAPCVMVTHCDAGQCLPLSVGANYTLGTKDFFYNDGRIQPGCYIDMFKSFLKGDLIYALIHLIPPFCPHVQCLEYYKTSICSPDCKWAAVECDNVNDFLSGKCNDCGETGEKCDIVGFHGCQCGKGNNKKYFTKGGLFCPYCDNKAIKNSDKINPRCSTEISDLYAKLF